MGDHVAHHKRKRPKNRRSGCLFCKHWKHNGERRRVTSANSKNLHDLKGTGKQEYRAYLNEKDGVEDSMSSEE